MAKEVTLHINSNRVLEPIPRLGETEDQATQYISLPAKDIVTLVNDYVAAIERQETDKWCRCEWFIHPDDSEIEDGCCRVCNIAKRLHHEEEHVFIGKRKRRGDQADDCPVHTKEGFLIYFFEWVFTGERD